MGNKSSSPMTPPCGGAVTAHPTTPVLTRRDANSLHQLYGHDPELLQLMTASEALRDLAKGARDACVTHFHDAMQASKKEHAFGVRLVAMSERMDSLGACLLEQTNGNALDTIGVLMETTGSDDDDGKETGEQAEEETEAPPEIGTSNESARRVLDVDRLSRKLGDAYVATAVARERVYGRLLDNMKKLARDLEKAHQVKLQRHAPSALAHEKAFNQMKAPEHRLARLNSLDDAHKDTDATAFAIDKAEVDFGKRKAQVEATSKMLAQRARHFLDTWTPKVCDALRGLNFAHADILAENATQFGEGCLLVTDCGGDVSAARDACASFLRNASSVESADSEDSTDSKDSKGDSQKGVPVAPHPTPSSSSADMNGDGVLRGDKGKGKGKGRANGTGGTAA